MRQGLDTRVPRVDTTHVHRTQLFGQLWICTRGGALYVRGRHACPAVLSSPDIYIALALDLRGMYAIFQCSSALFNGVQR